MQQIRERSGITATQIPKLVGITIFSWLFTFLIISSLLTLLFSFFLGPWLPKLLTQNAGDLASIVVELVVVALLVVICLDLVVGKRLLFGGTDELMHPVTWTWYATIMLLFNIAKGAALAATRIAYMICLNLCQFAIVDKTSFPQGTEGMDPAYSSFVGMVFFAVKYRNPVLLSLSSRHESKTERQHASQAHATRAPDRGRRCLCLFCAAPAGCTCCAPPCAPFFRERRAVEPRPHVWAKRYPLVRAFVLYCRSLWVTGRKLTLLMATIS